MQGGRSRQLPEKSSRFQTLSKFWRTLALVRGLGSPYGELGCHLMPSLHKVPYTAKPEEPLCPLCRKPVPLEDSKTDEHGAATHEQCYVNKVCSPARSGTEK